MAVRRILKSVSVRTRRRVADMSPAEQARARRDRDAIAERFPVFGDCEQVFQRLEAVFGPYHKDYCAGTGHPVHAASVELICFLLVLAKASQAERIVDLGSGLTSFALRKLALEIEQGGGVVVDALGGWDGPAPVITSVDDSPEWLEKTRGYLDAQGVSSERLWVWKDFVQDASASGFDLVLHDMGFMDVREATMLQAIGLAKAGGAVVLDDMHKTDFREAALRDLETAGLPALSARSFTRDSLTRFAYLTFAS